MSDDENRGDGDARLSTVPRRFHRVLNPKYELKQKKGYGQKRDHW